jgi:minor tail protein
MSKRVEIEWKIGGTDAVRKSISSVGDAAVEADQKNTKAQQHIRAELEKTGAKAREVQQRMRREQVTAARATSEATLTGSSKARRAIADEDAHWRKMLRDRESALRSKASLEDQTIKKQLSLTERLATSTSRANERQIYADKRVAAKAADDKRRAAEKAAAAEDAHWHRLTKARDVEAKRSAATRTAHEEKSVRDQIAFSNRLATAKSKLQEQTDRQAERSAEKARLNGQRQVVREAYSTARDNAYGRRHVIAGAFGGVQSAVGDVMSAAAGVTGAVGVGGVLAGVREAAGLRHGISGLLVATREGDQYLGGTSSPEAAAEAVRRDTQGLARRDGIAATDFVGAIRLAADRGGGLVGANLFRANMGLYSNMALATDTDIKDVASNVATFANFGIKDPEQAATMMRIVAQASKKGNIGLNEMGGLLGRAVSGAMANDYGGTTESKTLQANSLMQIGRRYSSSRQDAATSVLNFYKDTAKKSDVMKSFGVATKNADGSRRDVIEQFIELHKKTKGDPDKIKDVYQTQSAPLASALGQILKEGGEAKLRETLKDFETGIMSVEEIERDAAMRRKEATVQFAIEMEKFKQKVGDQLLPKLTELIPRFAQLAEAMAGVVTFAAEHPIAATSGYITGKAVLGAGGAYLHRIADRSLAPAPVPVLGSGRYMLPITAATPGSGLGGGAYALQAATAAGPAGAMGLGTIVAAGAALTIIAAGATIAIEGAKSARDDLADPKNKQAKLATALETGTATPEQVAEAKRLLDEHALSALPNDQEYVERIGRTWRRADTEMTNNSVTSGAFWGAALDVFAAPFAAVGQTYNSSVARGDGTAAAKKENIEEAMARFTERTLKVRIINPEELPKPGGRDAASQPIHGTP